jgi:hypothetical protein
MSPQSVSTFWWNRVSLAISFNHWRNSLRKMNVDSIPIPSTYLLRRVNHLDNDWAHRHVSRPICCRPQCIVRATEVFHAMQSTSVI